MPELYPSPRSIHQSGGAVSPGNCTGEAKPAQAIFDVLVRRTGTDGTPTSFDDFLVVRMTEAHPEVACHRAILYAASSRFGPSELVASIMQPPKN